MRCRDLSREMFRCLLIASLWPWASTTLRLQHSYSEDQLALGHFGCSVLAVLLVRLLERWTLRGLRQTRGERQLLRVQNLDSKLLTAQTPRWITG